MNTSQSGGAGEGESVLAWAAQLDAARRAEAAATADKLRAVVGLGNALEREVQAELASGPAGANGRTRAAARAHDDQLVESAVCGQVQALLGLSEFRAVELLTDARALITRLPATLAALAGGEIDGYRAHTLVVATEDLTRADAQSVEETMLALLRRSSPDAMGAAGWPEPRAWRERLGRVVARVDPDAARRRREAALRDLGVRAWPEPHGCGILQIRDLVEETAIAWDVISDLARAQPDHDEHGRPLSLDQRRLRALRALFRAVQEGTDLPHTGIRHERELALVLHADTLFHADDQPDDGQPDDAKSDPPAAADTSTVTAEDTVTVEDTATVEDTVTGTAVSRADLAADIADDPLDPYLGYDPYDEPWQAAHDPFGRCTREPDHPAATGPAPDGGRPAATRLADLIRATEPAVPTPRRPVSHPQDPPDPRWPAAHDPGQLRALGRSEALDAVTARRLALGMLTAGARTWVVLTGLDGVPQRMLRIGAPPAAGWTPASLARTALAALEPVDRERLARGQPLPPLVTDRYAPTAAITELVRARNPRCAGYDCARAARRCDLDHDLPWPRGPTSSDNLCPRCRRHHELKTRRIVRTRLHRDGAVTTVAIGGLVHTTRPEPLPGHAPGEGYCPRATEDACEAVNDAAPAARADDAPEARPDDAPEVAA